MRVRVTAVVLALVIVPAVVFAIGESSSSPRRFVSPGTAYVSPQKEQSGADIRSAVALYLARHPGGSCETDAQTAICRTDRTTELILLVAGSAP